MTDVQIYLLVVPFILLAMCGLGVVGIYLMPRPSEEEIKKYRAERRVYIAGE
jgi:hypothetical protein